ncbi:hypothetical protein B0H14DRAFT_2646969 [Mycena olivaceomarginata]|nr:hypothetical protein B0H14DRAFT_2646969 [Mycena olivaceomarginata]
MSNTKLHAPGNPLGRESVYLTLSSRDVVLTFGITGVVLPALLLLVIAYAAWNPVSRYYLNRSHFRRDFHPGILPPKCRVQFYGVLRVEHPHVLSILVLVHHVNGNLMEKFYYIGSVAVVAILNIAPYAADQFGYYNGTCWFSTSGKTSFPKLPLIASNLVALFQKGARRAKAGQDHTIGGNFPHCRHCRPNTANFCK